MPITKENSWKSELNKTIVKYHTIALWVAVIFDLLFFVTDYLNIYNYWQEFLTFRISVSFICLMTVLFHKKLNINLELMGVIPVLLISVQNAYMWSVMDVQQFQQHAFAYIALFIGSGMFMFYHLYYSILIVVVNIIANIILLYFNSELTVDEILVNGGFLTVAVAIFSILLIRMRYRLTKKEIIARYALEKQKEVVEEKNKEITDSITYAKRIQEAILPSRYSLAENLHNGFALFKPKDIVSGDFYWVEHKDGKVLFAAADCTGHGVPGAMVSVICNNGLNRSVREYGITEPGKILDKTREILIAEFEKSEEDVKDGMDISLCSLQLSKSSELLESYAMLQWAGANNPLWVIRPTVNANETKQSATQEQIGTNKQIASLPSVTGNDGNKKVGRNDENYELIEIKGNKQPIGKVDNPQPFTTHTLELQKGDTIYVFTDGFADQFGGPKGKKFMYKPFKNLLLSIQDKEIDKQKEILEKKFNEWQGSLEQVDDVCIIGVRI